MAPKRKGATSSKKPTPKKAKAEPDPPEEPTTSVGTKSTLTVTEVWQSSEFVQGGAMTQGGFAALCDKLQVEQMSFEAFYLIYTLSPEITDVMVVCSSKTAFQRGVDSLGCKTPAELPVKLKQKRIALQSEYSARFRPFFVWLFDMGKNIAAMNSGADVGVVRSVPLDVGLQLMEAVLGSWRLFPKLKEFCETSFAQPLSKDLWTQICRFVEMTTSGQIQEDLSNYDDDLTGGGSAWPCMIDDFVEFAQKS